MKVTCIPNAYFKFWLFMLNIFCFSILVLKKTVLFCYKTCILRLYFRGEGHLYAKCLFLILTIYPKCHLFHFFSCSIGMHIAIVTEAQNGGISGQKDCFFTKHFLFEAFFQWWRSLVFQMLIRYFDYLSKIPYSSFF